MLWVFGIRGLSNGRQTRWRRPRSILLSSMALITASGSSMRTKGLRRLWIEFMAVSCGKKGE
ncbi:hypothetical protein D9M69_604330 [compost metagenome]